MSEASFPCEFVIKMESKRPTVASHSTAIDGYHTIQVNVCYQDSSTTGWLVLMVGVIHRWMLFVDTLFTTIGSYQHQPMAQHVVIACKKATRFFISALTSSFVHIASITRFKPASTTLCRLLMICFTFPRFYLSTSIVPPLSYPQTSHLSTT